MGAMSSGPIITFGMTVGVTLMMMAFLLVMPAVVRFPGSHCGRFWSSGYVLMVSSLAFFGWSRAPDQILFRLIGFAGVLAAYSLLWAGDRYFRLQRPGNAIWLVSGLAFVVYSYLEVQGLSLEMRAAILAVCAILFWTSVIYKYFEGAALRLTLPNCLYIGGAGILIGSSVFRLLIAFEWMTFSAFFSDKLSYEVTRYLGTMLGGIMLSGSHLLRYFERVVQQSNHSATHDELTGLLNRRAIVANGEREIELARRNRQPLAVVFVDIDFFKKINDQYGHDQGDLALREVALVLQRNCRSVDLIGRYGGEEFCMILTGDDHAGAVSVGERLLVAVRDHQITALHPVTISIGLAVLDLDDGAQTWHSLINLADVELYKAKHSGRNRYSIASKKAPVEEIQVRLPVPTLASAT